MKNLKTLFLILLLTKTASAAPLLPPHLDLEISGEETRAVLQKQKSRFAALANDSRLQHIIAVGTRNLNWLKFINQHRSEANKISFSSAATQKGIPITEPRRYNPDIIAKQYADTMPKLPAAMREVLEDGKEFTKEPPISDEEYIKWGQTVNRLYDIAARWEVMEPYLLYLEGRKKEDVRGYYYLSRENGLEEKLVGWTSLPLEERNRLRPWLINICVNDGNTTSNCNTQFNAKIRTNKLVEYLNKYLPVAEALWNSFFDLEVHRDDAIWSASNQGAEQLSLPFVDPKNQAIRDFLMNIESEWRWNQWQLKLLFQEDNGDIPYVVFVPGVTPHVDGLGGNEITMDANEPLTEYNVQWTIRHEFGHVLGFRDCYVEFYERADEVIISYQLNINNIMCSRRGKIQETHYSELKDQYTK